MNRLFTSIFSLLVLCISVINAQDKYEINLKPTIQIPSTLYGIFFEDINYGADGGLYAELVKNRSFEFPNNYLQGWKIYGNVTIKDDGPFERNPHYARLGFAGHPQKWTGLQNEGFFGMGVIKDEEYRLSFWARTSSDSSILHTEIINPSSDENGQSLAYTTICVKGNEWTKYEVILKPISTFARAHLRIFLLSKETSVDIEHISLFPINTWNKRENGMRKDLAQALYDLHPGIFRFPGGCIVEGTNITDRYNWKNSVGPVENRPLNPNRWQYTFSYRSFPDYYQSYGIGFYEYFLLSEDIGAEPLPVLNCGLVCQFQNSDDCQIPVDSLNGYIQDALDLIEFANGDTTSKWGGIRAQMGHPKPFSLKYIAIGNEQWGEVYTQRLSPFIKAIKAKYPNINIIGSAGPSPDGDQFNYLWSEMKKIGADLVDEHFYRPCEWFMSQGARYDSYDRKGPKVFAGEYACHASDYKINHFHAALMEAAFMTSIERNADIVKMATYAPLFAHNEGWQWRPDLIWFDNLRVMRTCSWYVQQLYSQYKGSHVLTLTHEGHNVTGKDGMFASAVSEGNLTYIKIINTTDTARNIELNFKGHSVKGLSCIRFSSDYPMEDNTLDNPNRFIPTEESFNKEGKSIPVTIEPQCFKIYILTK